MNPNFFFFIPPITDGAAPSHRKPVNFAGTGTTESSNSAARFIPGRKYVLTVGSTPVRIAFSDTQSAANVVNATNSLIIPANSYFCFECVQNKDEGWGSRFLYVEAADGTSAYTASAVCVN